MFTFIGKIASITTLDFRFWKLMTTATGSMAVPLIFCCKSLVSLCRTCSLSSVNPVIRNRGTMQRANKKPQDFVSWHPQRTQTPSPSDVNLSPFPTSQADGKYFSLCCTLSPSLQTPSNTAAAPKCQRKPPPCCFTPLCVWFGSAPFPPALAMFTPFLQPFLDLLELPCSSWNASTNLLQEKSSSNTHKALWPGKAGCLPNLDSSCLLHV